MKEIYNFLQGCFISFICFQLTWLTLPQAHASSCPNYDPTGDSGLIASQKACDEQTAKNWNCELSRCEVTESETQEAIKKQFEKDAYGDSSICDGKTGEAKETCLQQAKDAACENKATPAERRQCYENAAKAQSGQTINEGDYEWYWEGIGQTLEGMALGIAVANYVATKKILVPQCYTLTVYNIAAIATIASELYYYFMLKGKLDSLKNAYVNNEDPFAAQLDAFNYLLEEQKTLKDILFQKAIITTALSALYFITMGVGIYEAVNPGGGKVCTEELVGSHNPNSLMDLFAKENHFQWNHLSKLQLGNSENALESLITFIDYSNFQQGATHSTTLEQYQQYRHNQMLQEFNSSSHQELKEGLSLINQMINKTQEIILPQALAQEEKMFEDETIFENGLYIAIIMGSSAAATMLLSLIEGVKPFFIQPSTLAVISGIIGVSQGLLAGHYWWQHGQIDGHITALEEIIVRFEESMQEYCSEEDRKDRSVPKCFCYNEDGTRKKERNNSATCKTLWTPKGTANFVAGDSSHDASKGRRGCIALNGQFDLECKCRQYRDASTGQNACYKSNNTAINLSGLPSFASQGISGITEAVDQMAEGIYNSGNFASYDSLNNRAAKSKKMAAQLAKASQAELKKQGLPPLKTMQAGAAKVFSQVENPRYARYGGFMPMDMAQKAQGKAKNAGAIQSALKKSGLRKILYSNSKGKGKKKLNFKFLEENESAKVAAKVSGGNFMEKKYKIKHNDIVKNQDASIWKVISNRYNQTGLRVLFED